jgi:hypothetical protein
MKLQRFTQFKSRISRSFGLVLIGFTLGTAACGPQQPGRVGAKPTATPNAWQKAQVPGAAEVKANTSAISEAIKAKATNLTQALTLVPNTAELVTFTNWSVVKAQAKAENVNSLSNINQQADLVKWLQEQTPFAAYAFAQVEKHATDWGWNSLDVVWEAATRVGETPLYVLKLRDDLDFAPIHKHFADRGFRKFKYLGAVVYAFSGTAAWTNTTQRSIFTTAIFESEKVLVMSYRPESVQAVLELNAGQTQANAAAMAQNVALKSTVAMLDAKPSAFLAKASFACKSLDAMAKDLGMSADNLGKFKNSFSTETVHAYSTFGMGYTHDGDKVIGTVVLHYDNADDARADMTIRQKDLRQGISLSNLQPYTELLTLDKATLQGNDIVLNVLPANNSPRTLWSMISRQDMAYARCPQAVDPNRASLQG